MSHPTGPAATSPHQHGGSPAQRGISPVQRVIGALLVVPALILLLVQFVLPSLQTLIMSMQDVVPIRPGSGAFVGFENYAAVAPDAIKIFPRTLLYAGPAILISIMLGLVIGAFAARGTRPVRMITRGLLGAALVLYAPVGVAVTVNSPQLAEPATAGFVVAGITTVALLTLSGAAAALVSLTAWRSPSGITTWIATAGLMLSIGLGLAIQLFSVPYALTAGGPGRSTTTPQALAVELAFIRMDFGPGAAVATMIGLVTAFFGILTVVLIVITRLRIELEPPRQESSGSGVGWIGLGVAALFLVIMVVLLGSWLAGTVRPWPDEISPRVLINTWAPSLVGTVIQVVVALAGGVGIGLFRPLGRFSEAALLLFAPWLLAGDGSFILQHYSFLRQFNLLDSFVALLPPAMLSVPALVGFTLLFAGVRRLRDRGAAAGAAVTPVLGVVLTSTLLLWLVQSQSLLLGYVFGARPESMTGPVALIAARGNQATRWEDLSQTINTPLPWLIVLGLVAIALQVFCLDRVRIATGTRDSG